MHLATAAIAGIVAGVKHASISERAAWARRYYQSGVSQLEFVRRHGLVLSTLRRWLRQNPASAPAPVFTEVKLPGMASRWAAEVVRADGAVVRLAHDVPVDLLQEILPRC